MVCSFLGVLLVVYLLAFLLLMDVWPHESLLSYGPCCLLPRIPSSVPFVFCISDPYAPLGSLFGFPFDCPFGFPLLSLSTVGPYFFLGPFSLSCLLSSML